MATEVIHSTLTDPELHEPKGVSTASAGEVYVADGSGSGSWTTPPVADGTVDDDSIASPSILKNRITDKNDVRDWDTSTAYSSSTAAAKIQAAADAFAAGTNLAPLYVPAGRVIIGSTLMLPASFKLQGAGKHDDLREYGDTTGGVAHPLRGTLFTTDFSAITARRWTDIDGSDADIKPAIILLGQNITLEDFTLYTNTALASACDTGIHIAGTGRNIIRNVDVRGGWKKGGMYLDATWGRDNTNLTGLAHLPTWFNADYKVLYDYGLTNNQITNCRLYGIRSLTIQGSTRASLGSFGSWVWAPNGISQTVFTNCDFYNEGDQTERLNSGANVYIDYKVSTTASAQNVGFSGCRFDIASKWMLYTNYIENLSIGGEGTFAETSEAWFTATASRGIIETTTNTGDLFLEGEIYADAKPAGGTQVDLRTKRFNNAGGEKIYYIDMRSTTRGSISWPWIFAYGADSGQSTDIMSWNGTIRLVSRVSGITTCISTSPTSTLIESLKTDTTASAANVNVNGTNGNVRQVTSLKAYKDIVSEVDNGLEIVSKLKPILYKSKLDGDDKDMVFAGFTVEDFLEAGLDNYVLKGSDGKPTGLAYDRITVPLANAVCQLEERIKKIEEKLKLLGE